MNPHPHTMPRRHCVARASAGVALIIAALSAGCATVPAPRADQLGLPLLRGWFEGQEVLYVTTDVSHADVAQAKGANFAPRLADALPPEGGALPGGRSAVDKVYGLTNFEQASVFASAPAPIGYRNQDRAYSPLWQLVKVTWAARSLRRTLKSEEDVLSAAEKGEVSLEATRVVLNCPIVHRGPDGGGLPDVSIGHSMPAH